MADLNIKPMIMPTLLNIREIKLALNIAWWQNSLKYQLG
jgi:hypothetical protein